MNDKEFSPARPEFSAPPREWAAPGNEISRDDTAPPQKKRRSLPAMLVAGAAALDVAANLMLARSDGFKKRLTGIGALALVGLAFYCLSLAVQYMDLAVAYAMWGSLGILGTSLCGWLFLRQRLRPCAFAGMGLLIIGMILLRTS